MVDIKTLHVGDRIKIVDEWGPGCRENARGEMDEWLGKVLTVSAVHAGWDFVRALESKDGCGGRGWNWFPAAIDYVVTDEPEWDYDGEPDALFQLL